MCGITGFLNFARDYEDSQLRSVVSAMTDTLQHRGPDAGDVWTAPEVGLAFGHRRLAIIDLSIEGCQPMHSADGRYVITYNGEIYNYQALRAQLANLGHKYRGTSDTEVMLAAFQEWGVEASIKRLVGMFAFGLWDRRERLLTLVRDRLGEKPLYYGWMGQHFVFGSELQALAVHPAFEPHIDRDALALYMRHNYIPAPHTIYQGIYKLLPGTCLTIALEAPAARPQPVPYWSAREAAEAGVKNPFAGTDEEAADALDNLLREATRLQMVSDVPLGAFLSGGIDSSTVVALMQAQSSRPVKTFTIGFHEQKYNEAEYAGEVARHLGTDHTELYVSPQQTLEAIPQMPAVYSEPFSDSSQIPTFLLSRLTRQHVTVSLSGDGGDELFAGYDRYYRWQRVWRRFGWMPMPLRRAMSSALGALPPKTWESLLTPFKAVLPFKLSPQRTGQRIHTLAELLRQEHTGELYLREISDWKDPAKIVYGSTEPPTSYTDSARWADIPDFFRQMMYLDLITYLPDDILVKVDRAAMSVSLETRVPMLDHRVVEFAWRLPLRLKYRANKSKWLLRQVLYRYVPPELIERPKQGFGIPIDEWLRGPLRDWAENLLDERRLRESGFFHVEPLRQRWLEHVSGRRDWHYDLWDVLMFQAWCDHHMQRVRVTE